MTWRPQDHEAGVTEPSAETGKLLPGEARVGDRVLTEREWAASVLGALASAGKSGSYPQQVDAFDIGRALSRICINKRASGGMEQMLKEIEQGWRHVNAARVPGGREP